MKDDGSLSICCCWLLSMDAVWTAASSISCCCGSPQWWTIMSHCEPKQSQLSQVAWWWGIYYSNRTATKTINMHLRNCCMSCILKGILRICIWILWLMNTQVTYCTTTVKRKSGHLLLAPYPVHQPEYRRRNVTDTRQAMPSSAC